MTRVQLTATQQNKYKKRTGDENMALDNDVDKASAEMAKKVEERRGFMLHTVDKYDLVFGNRGYEDRIKQAGTEQDLMGISKEMDDLLVSDPKYMRMIKQICSQIDNPMVNPRQRIHHPPGFSTYGRSSESLAKYGRGYSGRSGK